MPSLENGSFAFSIFCFHHSALYFFGQRPKKSGRHDLNMRPLRPERSALARLSYAPYVDLDNSVEPAVDYECRHFIGTPLAGKGHAELKTTAVSHSRDRFPARFHLLIGPTLPPARQSPAPD